MPERHGMQKVELPYKPQKQVLSLRTSKDMLFLIVNDESQMEGGGLGEFHVHLALTPETHATFQRNKMNTFLLLFWIAVRMRKEYICKNPTFLGRKVQGCLPSLPPACLGVQIFCTLWPWAAETGMSGVDEGEERKAIKGQRGRKGGREEGRMHFALSRAGSTLRKRKRAVAAAERSAVT